MTRNTTFALLLMLLGMAGSQPAGAMTPEERREYLAKLQQILPDVPSFREWLARSGQLGDPARRQFLWLAGAPEEPDILAQPELRI